AIAELRAAGPRRTHQPRRNPPRISLTTSTFQANLTRGCATFASRAPGGPDDRSTRGGHKTMMNRRHFLSHVAGAAPPAVPGLHFLNGLRAAQPQLKKENKSLIILWMGGGPSHMDLWDLKPGSQNGGEFKPIQTSASGVEISE